MKVGWLRVVGGSICSLALLLAGCAEAYEEPEYPRAPAQQAAQTEPVGVSNGSASLEANPPAPPPPNDIAIGVDEQNYADTDPSALTEFQGSLEPYGTWTDDPNYGSVWQPSQEAVGADFTPYVSAGHWAYDDDWVWVSDYSWGWAPFHYGRWVSLGPRGWGWIPGRTYRGAWVTWRVGYGAYDYVGWAPMAPTWYWRGGYAVGLYGAPAASYYYCPHRDVFSPVIAGRVAPAARVPVIAANTRPYDPQFGGARSVAAPSVGARVGARPGVGYGPSPSSLGIPNQAVARALPSDPGISRARAFAAPSSAVAVGARPPQGFASGAGPRAVASPSPSPGALRGPQLGASVARPMPVPSGPTRLPDHGQMPNYTPPPRAYASPSAGSPTYVGPRPSSPNFPRPSYAPQPRPSYAPQNVPSFRSGPSVSAPYRAPTPSPTPSPPAFHAPSSGPTFHGGGGGGFHGGGGGSSHVGGSPHVGGGARSSGGRR